MAAPKKPVTVKHVAVKTLKTPKTPRVSRKGIAPPIVYSGKQLAEERAKAQGKRGDNQKPTARVLDEIFDRIAAGEPLITILRDEKKPHLPTVPLFYRWLEADELLVKRYIRAKEHQAETIAQEMVHIANTPQQGKKTVTKDTKDGVMVEVTEGDMIEHRRLQIEARRWLAGKLAPKKYGDKIQQEHTGADGGPMIVQLQPGDEKL